MAGTCLSLHILHLLSPGALPGTRRWPEYRPPYACWGSVSPTPPTASAGLHRVLRDQDRLVLSQGLTGAILHLYRCPFPGSARASPARLGG